MSTSKGCHLRFIPIAYFFFAAFFFTATAFSAIADDYDLATESMGAAIAPFGHYTCKNKSCGKSCNKNQCFDELKACQSYFTQIQFNCAECKTAASDQCTIAECSDCDEPTWVGSGRSRGRGTCDPQCSVGNYSELNCEARTEFVYNKEGNLVEEQTTYCAKINCNPSRLICTFFDD